MTTEDLHSDKPATASANPSAPPTSPTASKPDPHAGELDYYHWDEWGFWNSLFHGRRLMREAEAAAAASLSPE